MVPDPVRIGVVALLAGTAAAQAPERVAVVARYDGKYAASDWVAPLLEHLQAQAAAGLDAVCERLGVLRSTVNAGRITVLLTDAASGTEARFPTVDQAAAYTATRPGARADAQSIVCFAEWLARPHSLAFEGVLRHELAHCVLAQRLRADSVLPAWVEEGLAVWASGDGDAFVRRTALGRALRRDTESVCDGLESRVEEQHRGADYAEDYLALVYLTELGGDKSVRSLVDELIAGRDFAAAIRAVCSRSWAAFHAGARIHATAHLTGQHDGALKAAIAVLRTARDRKDRATLDGATRFLAEHPQAPEVGAVLFVRAAALTNLRKFAEGRDAFAKAFERGSIFDDACLYYIATIHGALGAHPAAASTWEQLVRDYPETPRLPEAAFDWGFALAAAGRTDRARDVLAKCLATWPQPRDPRRLERARALLRE